MGSKAGEEILKFFNKKSSTGNGYLNDIMVKAFTILPYVKIAIYVLLVVILMILVLRIFRIKSFFKGKGISSELSNANDIKSRDKQIIKYNKFLRRITNTVQNTPFRLNNNIKEYYQYNLNRSGIKAPGGLRYIAAEEFHSIIQVVAFGLILISFILAVAVNTILGIVLAIATVASTATLPMIVIRGIVSDKDREIKDNFSDFYLMLHYVLMQGGSTPLDRLMKSFAKTTSSEEMKRFIDNCVNHIDTHGEYNATRLIARDYREIAEVGKLMRLVRQLYDGGDIRQELLGFKEELLQNEKHMIGKRRDKLVGRARASFKILTIVLIQAILSAMAIYLPDLAIMKGLFVP